MTKVKDAAKRLLNRCYVQQMHSAKKNYTCGHTGASSFILWIFGRGIPSHHLSEQLCPECSLKEKIAYKEFWRCAICGNGIFVGERIGLCKISGVTEVYKKWWSSPYNHAYLDGGAVAVCKHHADSFRSNRVDYFIGNDGCIH